MFTQAGKKLKALLEEIFPTLGFMSYIKVILDRSPAKNNVSC
jgi:hypothetical protein